MALSAMNRALNKTAKRAEKQEGSQLHETFVDSGVADVLDTVDGQVLYGRRGTGKTHALSYLELEAVGRDEVAVRLDLRTVGSADGIVNAASGTPAERAGRLLVDLLGQLRDGLYDAFINNDELWSDETFIQKADSLLAAITDVRVTGEVERSVEAEHKSAQGSAESASVNVARSPTVTIGASTSSQDEGRLALRETRKGAERFSLNFSDVARALRELADSLTTKRIWLLLDEWSSVPLDLQPYLGEFIVRCVLPLQKFTVKVAAIEQQTNFRAVVDDGRRIGIELGADLGANINLDDFLVFESNEEQSREFFQGLFFKHLRGTEPVLEGFSEPRDVIRLGFTDTRAFDELVRAAEGVPRDALYIAGRAAGRAGEGKISVPLIRDAARYWYETDKSRPFTGPGRDEAQRLLNWLIAKVIREKKARAFLVREADSADPLLLALFDARVLHIVRRGYSAQDQPGERFDVWVIDYGAYVDLLNTQNAPKDLVLFGDEENERTAGDVEVPFQDLRAIRRAVLNLEEFYAAAPGTVQS